MVPFIRTSTCHFASYCTHATHFCYLPGPWRQMSSFRVGWVMGVGITVGATLCDVPSCGPCLSDFPEYSGTCLACRSAKSFQPWLLFCNTFWPLRSEANVSFSYPAIPPQSCPSWPEWSMPLGWAVVLKGLQIFLSSTVSVTNTYGSLLQRSAS